MKRRAEEMGMNMTPMIDVVFQLIIFFVVTISLQDNQMDMKLRLAMAPNGKAVEKKDPRTIYVDVDKTGQIRLGGGKVAIPILQSVLTKAVREGGQELPVVIRADGKTVHDDVRKVMDVCSRAGLYRIKFAAIKSAVKRPAEGGG